MVAVEGIVADVGDEEHMHRIRVIIPSVDESIVHDEWVAALVPWVGPAGYGPVNLPEIGSEVLLFGRLGQKHSLFYLCRFNEDFSVPGQFVDDGARGLKTDGKYKLLADLVIHIASLTQVKVAAGALADVDAPDVRLMSGDAVGVHAQGAKVGFMGAAPVGRQPLPAQAINLATCIALANAARAALIAQGLCVTATTTGPESGGGGDEGEEAALAADVAALTAKLATHTEVITADATLDLGDSLRAIVMLDTSGGDVTLTLPPLTGMSDRTVVLKKIADANIGIVDGHGSELIDGGLVFNLEMMNEFIEIAPVGGQWRIIGRS
jgi:hypothetical protein